MAVVARDRFQIQQSVVKRVRGWGRSIKTVKRLELVQDAVIVLRANLVKQRVGGETGKIWRNLVRG